MLHNRKCTYCPIFQDLHKVRAEVSGLNMTLIGSISSAKQVRMAMVYGLQSVAPVCFLSNSFYKSGTHQ